MRERPILFSGEMVRAILDGRKSQTRRVMVPQPIVTPHFSRPRDLASWRRRPNDRAAICWFVGEQPQGANGDQMLARCPYGQPGDRLYVRETFQVESNYHVDCRNSKPPFNDGRPIFRDSDPDYPYWEQCHYAATDPCPELLDVDTDDLMQRWKPSIYMPRWASRITLEITGVRVERLQDITEDDAVAEGRPRHNKPPESISTVEMFAASWNGLKGKRGYGWDANPWVWVIEFNRAEA